MPSDVATKAGRLTPNEARLVAVAADAAARRVTLTRTELGTLAGYGEGEAARVSAFRALQRPHVRAALMEAAAGILAEGAPDAAAMLRHVVNHGRPGERLSASTELLKMLGMGQAEGQAGGNIAVQVVLPAELGALLTQARPVPAQVIDHEGEAPGPRHRGEGEGRRATPPRPSKRKAGKSGGRGRKRAAIAPVRASRAISPPPETASGGETGEEGSER